MAHKRISHVIRLAAYFKRQCDVFISLDKKGTYDADELQTLESMPQVKGVFADYEVNWGGSSVLDSEMALIRAACRNSNYDYYHLISGQDYPIRPLSAFLDYFEQNAGREFLQYIHIPHPKWEHGTYQRFQYYYPYDYAVNKENPRGWVREQVRRQIANCQKRPIPDHFDHLYGSSQWFSLSNKAITELLDYTDKHPDFYNRLWMTFAPEECYVATVVINLLGTDNIIQSNLRFIRWKFENGNCPANLNMEHYYMLLEQPRFFARKMNESCSNELLNAIDKYLLQEEEEMHLMPNGGWHYNGFLKYVYDSAFCSIVAQVYRDIAAKSAIDVGCGCGYYVSQWIRKGLNVSGFDANPYAEQLSHLLLPVGNPPCAVRDITDNTFVADASYDLVICNEVLPFIPERMLTMAVTNLARLSSHCILIGWENSCKDSDMSLSQITEENLRQMFEKEEFIIENYMTARLRLMTKNRNYCLFIKRGMQLINNF